MILGFKSTKQDWQNVYYFNHNLICIDRSLKDKTTLEAAERKEELDVEVRKLNLMI